MRIGVPMKNWMYAPASQRSGRAGATRSAATTRPKRPPPAKAMSANRIVHRVARSRKISSLGPKSRRLMVLDLPAKHELADASEDEAGSLHEHEIDHGNDDVDLEAA